MEIIEPEEIVGEEEEGDEQWTGSSEEEDTMEEELYECKVEVKTREANIPTSVRTIESVVDVPGWAPITPYLNVSKSLPASSAEEVSAIFSEGKHGMQYMTAGVVTSPESVMTSTNLITTPDSSISLQSQLSTNEVREAHLLLCQIDALNPLLISISVSNLMHHFIFRIMNCHLGQVLQSM